MAKQKLTGCLHEPLAAIFGSRAKVAVLRILWRASSPLHYREVVRRSGMAYGSIDLALGDLTATGLVEELEGGRERRVRLRSAHRLAAAVGSLMQVESDFFATLRIELRTIAQACQSDGLLSAAIIGAVARQKELLGSDVEIVLIGKDAPAVRRSVARFEAAREMLVGRFGATLKVIGYDSATARTMWRTRTAAAERNAREAELLHGLPMAELLDA